MIRWKFPKKGWVKINFDGASKGNKVTSGAGAVARNEKREIIGIAVKRLIDGTNNTTKVEAVMLAGIIGKKTRHYTPSFRGRFKIGG